MNYSGNDELVADLSDNTIKAYVNIGYGITSNGVTHSDRGITFENVFSDFNAFPMFALDFSDYLLMNNIAIEDVKSFEIVAAIYDEAGEEIDLSLEYQKCAFVSHEALDGYSPSDILPGGNYKAIGSGIVTTFDLTKYTGYSSDGNSLSASTLEEGAGFNIQIINGEHSHLKYLVLSHLKFIL